MKKSAALVLALFTMLFISLLVVAFLDIIGIEQQIATNHIYALRAEYIADAGIETAVCALKQDSGYDGSGGGVEFPAASGNTYDVVVDASTITSCGTVGDFSVTLSANFTLSGSAAPYSVNIDSWRHES